MKRRGTSILFLFSLFLTAPATPSGSAQQPAVIPVKAVHLMGLPKVKNDAKGTLNVGNGALHFVYGQGNSDLGVSSIWDVVTGNDSQKSVGKTIGTLSMAAPYGGGRFLSLFRTKIDTLTIEYRDTDGALHGVIFTMHAGTADSIKRELVAEGARTTIPLAPAPVGSAPGQSKERKP